MEIILKPKNIIIIGGAGGIGFAIAQKLLDSGARSIILASRDQKKLLSAKEKLSFSENQHVYCLSFDITKINSQTAFLEDAQKMIGEENQIDGLVISSGKNFDGSNWKGFNISEFDWDQIMNTNLKGVFFLMRNFANKLHSKGIKGNICIISSVSAHRDLLSVYQISKLSVSRIVHAYGKYLAERGIILNCIEPGPIYTDMMQWLEKYTDGVRPGIPWPDSAIHRLVRPEEIAAMVFILMSNLSEMLSGSCILAGGGTKSIFP